MDNKLWRLLDKLGVLRVNGGDKLQVHGAVSLTLFHEDGTVTHRVKNNLIVDVGFDFICDAIGLSTGRPNVISHIAVGSGTTAPAPGNTALESEIGRKAGVYNHTAGTKIFTFQTTFNPGEATGAITEAGIFNAAVGGAMLDRVTFAVVNKGVNDTLVVTFTFTLSLPS
mgnify:CR=1 FL=1